MNQSLLNSACKPKLHDPKPQRYGEELPRRREVRLRRFYCLILNMVAAPLLALNKGRVPTSGLE